MGQVCDGVHYGEERVANLVGAKTVIIVLTINRLLDSETLQGNASEKELDCCILCFRGISYFY